MVYIPSDFNQEEYRLFTKLAIDDLESYKRDSYQNITALQKSIEAIVDLFANQDPSISPPNSQKVTFLNEIPAGQNYITAFSQKSHLGRQVFQTTQSCTQSSVVHRNSLYKRSRT